MLYSILLCLFASITIITKDKPLPIYIICVAYLGSVDYIENSRTWCTPYLKPKTRYGSFLEAQEACSSNNKCSMFYDYRGRNYYYLCGYHSRIKMSRKGSTAYKKPHGKCILSYFDVYVTASIIDHFTYLILL